MQRNSATNVTLDIHDLFVIYVRFTERFFLSNRDSQSTKKPDHGVTIIPLPPHQILLCYVQRVSSSPNEQFIAIHMQHTTCT